MLRLLAIGFILTLTACSSGKTALRSGRFDEAVEIAARRYARKPNHKHARFVLEEAFRAAYNRHQRTIQTLAQSEQSFRWEKVVGEYRQLQRTTNVARRSGLPWTDQYPASYAQNLTEVRNLAAADRYEAAEQAYPYHKTNLQAARDAHIHYEHANDWVNNYRDACAKAAEVQPYAILRVVVEPPVPTRELSEHRNRDFQRLVFDRIGQRWSPSPLSRVYMGDPEAGEGYPIHQVVQMQIHNHSSQSESITSSCRTVESSQEYVVGKKKINDTTEVDVKEKVKGTITTHRRTLTASLSLNIRAIDRQADCLAWDDRLYETVEWYTEWETFSGDERALNGHTLASASILVPSDSEFLSDLIRQMANAVRYKLRRTYD